MSSSYLSKARDFAAVLLLVFFALATGAQGAQYTQSPDLSVQPEFSQWLVDLRAEALTRGISAELFDDVTKGVVPAEEVLERDRHQPEFRLTFDRYLERAVTDVRVERGRELLNKHAALLREVHEHYGVQPRFLVAFWALESNFGEYTGNFSVIEALVTLAYDTRRSEFFREQLIHALIILEEGHIEPAAMAGSWAGAMGQLQFIPSTFTGYAVDYNKDGRKDIWSNLPDVFGSAANFLSASGWDGDRTWGREVLIPADFDWELTGLSVSKSLYEWQSVGVRRADGRDLPKVDIEGSLVLPAGHRGPVFMVYQNFRTIMVWNRSLLYALAVGHLADRLAGGGSLQTNQDYIEEPMTRADIEDLQRALNALGFDAGKPDGLAGRKTRAALKEFQKERGRPADGHPNLLILRELQNES